VSKQQAEAIAALVAAAQNTVLDLNRIIDDARTPDFVDRPARRDARELDRAADAVLALMKAEAVNDPIA
jgi:hypothetical protein